MKRLACLLLCAAVLVCSSCINMKDRMVTKENRDTIISEAEKSKDLTPEEQQLLESYAVRRGLEIVLLEGGEPGQPYGKTIGEMIDEQRAWRARIAQEEKVAAAVAAKQAEMRKIIDVSLYGFNERQGSSPDAAQAKFAYENRSAKDVKVFEGTVAFSDAGGDHHLANVPLKVEKPFKPGSKAKLSEELPFETYGKLKGKKLEDVKVEWEPKKILFADGTSADDGSVKP